MTRRSVTDIDALLVAQDKVNTFKWLVSRYPDLFRALAEWLREDGDGKFEIHKSAGKIRGWRITRTFLVESKTESVTKRRGG